MMPHLSKTGPAPDLTSATRLQAIIELYKEQCAHGRHTEGQRHLVTAMFLTAAGALLTIVSFNKFASEVWPLAACVPVLGLLGLGFARVYEIKWDEACTRRNYYRELMEDFTDLSGIPNDYVPRHMDPEKSSEKPKFARLRHYWRVTFVFVIIAGAVALALCLDI